VGTGKMQTFFAVYWLKCCAVLYPIRSRKISQLSVSGNVPRSAIGWLGFIMTNQKKRDNSTFTHFWYWSKGFAVHVLFGPK
jgi:hypothetical protein